LFVGQDAEVGWIGGAGCDAPVLRIWRMARKEKLALSCQRRKNRYIIQGFAEWSWLSRDSWFCKVMKTKKFSKV
jgi:hypothetical protein